MTVWLISVVSRAGQLTTPGRQAVRVATEVTWIVDVVMGTGEKLWVALMFATWDEVGEARLVADDDGTNDDSEGPTSVESGV